MTRWALCAVMLLAFVPASAEAAALSPASRVGIMGVGPIVVGTTPAQAAATGTKFVASKPAPGSTCFYLRLASIKGLALMVESGTIRRAEVTTPTFRTTANFRVGDPIAPVIAYYKGHVTVAADKYDPKARTVTVVPQSAADAKYRMIFKVKNGAVQAIFAGALPQVEYVEGCS